MWSDSFNHKSDHKPISITGITPSVWLSLVIVPHFSSFHEPSFTKATAGFTSAGHRSVILQKRYKNNRNIMAWMSPTLPSQSEVGGFHSGCHMCDITVNILFNLARALFFIRAFGVGTTNQAGEDKQLQGRHQIAILPKNVPHLQQEGSFFCERCHQGTRSV